ncbi:hypothetical protein QAD02_024195 [Eretmocerus hayati]|uniref:Uncharacterized protein n=1 Tax=Eretmocerus hayati TaxID=131215 RepID=A0ACC2PYB9_9HYME|nr:hypothetical protein QAD02_024195 [Eretmocerus hayati]
MAKVIKKKKFLCRDELEQMDKPALIDKVLQLEAHNQQLKQILEKKMSTDKGDTANSSRKFDFTKCHKRHILLKFYYLGWDFQGFASQEDSLNTIEYHLFNALMKSCLIENRESSNYHRCGRTDKGVSAFSQVISLDIRSSLKPEDQYNISNELLYCKILNRLLPKTIRCISWCPVSSETSARFDCKWRKYKYYFPRGNLNIEAMDEAAKLLIGSHDFRNFCKMDVANGVINFQRTILDAAVACTVKNNQNITTGYDMCELTIRSNAFLWHQIRCIMGILFLVGRHQEEIKIVSDLLDIEKCPRKPQYNLALHIPLNLFCCEYDSTDWFHDVLELEKVVKDLQEEWCYASVKATMTKDMLDNLRSLFSDEMGFPEYQSNCLLQGVEPKVYKPLVERETCESLEDRIEHYTKKQRIKLD